MTDRSEKSENLESALIRRFGVKGTADTQCLLDSLDVYLLMLDLSAEPPIDIVDFCG